MMGDEDVKEAEARKGEGAPTSTAVHSPAAYIKGSPPIPPYTYDHFVLLL
jgi:hypothetical protein